MATISNNGTGRRINVEDAKIRTAAVEIKSLTVSGKQVTLAVFRQLERRDLYTHSRDREKFKPPTQLDGVPWGWVNYHTKELCGKLFGDDDHMHVVWQSGDKLFVDDRVDEFEVEEMDKELCELFFTLDQLFIAV